MTNFVKNSTKVTSVIFGSLFVLSLLLPSMEGMKCRVMVGLSTEGEKVFKDCRTSNPVDFEKHPARKGNVTVEDFDFDDNCNQQCVYKGLDMLSPEGKVKKDQVGVYFKDSELEGEILTKFTSIWNQCITDTEKIAKDKGFNECKAIRLMDFCFGFRSFSEKDILERKCC